MVSVGLSSRCSVTLGKGPQRPFLSQFSTSINSRPVRACDFPSSLIPRAAEYSASGGLTMGGLLSTGSEWETNRPPLISMLPEADPFSLNLLCNTSASHRVSVRKHWDNECQVERIDLLTIKNSGLRVGLLLTAEIGWLRLPSPGDLPALHDLWHLGSVPNTCQQPD